MKIAFLCGSLEPGKDGVGDYTRKLAAKLNDNGHCVTLIAINDPHLTNTFQGEQEFETIKLEVLRIPSSLHKAEKFDITDDWIQKFDPDLISLQFVIYAFNPRGLPLGFGKNLLKFGKNRKWHIMFHELWIGMKIGSSKKEILVGSLQKEIIRNLIKVLDPCVVHTQTKLYQFLLDKMGFNVHYLPLFSNISVKNMKFDTDTLGKITLVVFGVIHPGRPIEHFAAEAGNYKKKENVEIEIVFIGRCGKEQDYWISICESNNLKVRVMGEQPSERISETLVQASIGITTNPAALVEKSGTSAAMLEHGLPVISISYPWIARGTKNMKISSQSGVVEYEFGNIERCLQISKKPDGFFSVEKVAQQFLNDLVNMCQ